MTLRLDKPDKRLILRLGKGEQVFKILGQTTWLELPDQAEPLGICAPSGLYLEIRKTRKSLPPGWRVIEGGHASRL